VRKQYHFRPTAGGTLIWDVDRLVELSQHLPRVRVPVASFSELDETYWFSDPEMQPTCRAVLEHTRLINEADLSFPVILSSDGRVMDGMHRIAKAVLEGRAEIEAVRFERDPEPDFRDRRPSELPY